jgi:hypothetical protein
MAGKSKSSSPTFLFFWPLKKNLTNVSLLERFQKMDPDLGAMDCGAELTRHGAMYHGAEMVQFLATVCERGVQRGQEVGALICGAELGAQIHGAEVPTT